MHPVVLLLIAAAMIAAGVALFVAGKKKERLCPMHKETFGVKYALKTYDAASNKYVCPAGTQSTGVWWDNVPEGQDATHQCRVL